MQLFFYNFNTYTTYTTITLTFTLTIYLVIILLIPYTTYTYITSQHDTKRRLNEIRNYLQYDSNATKNCNNTAIQLLTNKYH